MKEDTLPKLAEIAAELNRATNTANDAFRRTEAFLEAISIGLPISLTFTGKPGVHYQHGRIRIASGTEDFADVPWENATRKSKLRSVVLLPDLLEAILSEALATQALAKEAETAAKTVLDALKAVAPRVNPQVARTVPPFVSEGLYVPRATP